jgi:hypothetical protein
VVALTTNTILDSLLWGFVASVPLIAGAVLASYFNVKKKI